MELVACEVELLGLALRLLPRLLTAGTGYYPAFYLQAASMLLMRVIGESPSTE